MIQTTTVEKVLLGWITALAYVTMMAVGWSIAANIGLFLVIVLIVLGWWRRDQETERVEMQATRLDQIELEPAPDRVELEPSKPSPTVDIAVQRLRQSLARQLRTSIERDRWKRIAVQMARYDGQRNDRGMSRDDWESLLTVMKAEEDIEKGAGPYQQRGTNHPTDPKS